MNTLKERLFQESRDLIYQYKEVPFQLSAGGESHHYFNCKKITLVPERLGLLARVIIEELLPSSGVDGFQGVGGLTMGSDPMAFALSLEYLSRGKVVYPLIVRKEPKGHGTGQQIEGEKESVKKVLLLDDVVTTAGSSLKAVRAFRESGIQVEAAVCIVDREEGGHEALEKEGIRLFPIFRKSDF